MLSSQTTDRALNKAGENFVGKKDVCNAPFTENIEVPVGKFVTLVEQAILLLGKASLWVSYTRWLNNLKLLMKDLRKVKLCLKKKS